MRVADEVALGEAIVSLRLEGWPEGRVVPSTCRLPVVARKPLQPVKVSPQQRGIWSFDGYVINNLRYTPDGRTLIVALDKSLKDGHLFQFRLWDVASGKERAKVLQVEPEPLRTTYSPYLEVSRDGKSLSIRYNLLRYTKVGKEYHDQENGMVHVIDVDSGRQRWSYEGDALGIYGAAFSPDSRTLVTGHTHCTKTREGRNQRSTFTGEVKFWDVAGEREKGGLPRGPYQIIWDVRFSPDGKYVWISDEHRDQSNRSSETSLHIWDVAAEKSRLRLASFSQAAFSPEGTRFAACTGKGNIKIIETHTAKELAALSLKLDGGWIGEPLWSLDSKYLFLASTQGELWRWEPASRDSPVKVESIPSEVKQPQRDASPQHWHLSAGLYAFGVNGKLPKRITRRTLKEDYAELPPAEVMLWDLKTMRRRATFTGHHGHINCLAFSPDGKTLASGDTDGTVRFWNLAQDEP